MLRPLLGTLRVGAGHRLCILLIPVFVILNITDHLLSVLISHVDCTTINAQVNSLSK